VGPLVDPKCGNTLVITKLGKKKKESVAKKHASSPSKPPHFFFSVREKAMASSSPCDYWPHLSHTLSSSPSPSPSSSSPSHTLLPPPPSSVEHVWNDLKLPSLSNSPVDFNHSSSHSSLLSLSSSHNHHSLLSVSNASFHSNHQDHRHSRIMKNRESAVRSRARKQVLSLSFLTNLLNAQKFKSVIFSVCFLQAYRKGLEVEIARLTEENSRLRKELKEVRYLNIGS